MKMNYMILLFLLLTIPSNRAEESSSAATGTVHKYLKEFSTLATPTIDWLEHIKLVSTNISRFLKMVWPATSVIAMALDSALSPGSPELVAIKELHKTVNEGFANIDRNLQMMEGRILHRLNMGTYNSDVTTKIDGMQRLCSRVTDPIFEIRQEYKNEFINACINMQTEPAQILRGIERLTRINCPTPSKKREQLYSMAIKQFWAIEEYYEPRFDTVLDGFFAYKSAKKEFLEKLLHVGTRIGKTMLHELQRDIGKMLSNTTTAISLVEFTLAVQNISGFQENINDLCIYNTALISNEDKTSAVHLISEMIVADVVKTLSIAGYCANATFNGSSGLMDDYLEEAGSIAKAILKFSDDWITKKLNNQWPSTQMEYALKTIKSESVLEEMYNQTAEVIARELIKRGLPDYHYHTLISKNWIGDEWYYGPVCFDSNCNEKLDYHGINIAIFRQPIKSRVLAQTANEWIDNWRQNITDIISREIDINSLRSLAQIIDGAIHGILHEQAYHGYVFIRNMKFLAKDCVIDFGIFTQPALTDVSNSMVEYFINPGIADAQRFKLFLFL